MAVTTESITEICRRARAASLRLATASTEAKDDALRRAAALLRERTAAILEANSTDVEAGRDAGLDDALIDRLSLDPERVEAMAVGLEAIIELADPVGELVAERTIQEGVELEQVRVPIGVVAIVYEARPNVTIDAAALCLKSGNAAVLRGSSSAAASNAVLAGIFTEAIEAAGLPYGSLELVAGGGREELGELARQSALRRPDHPARRRGTEERAEGGRRGAGALRGGRQLPRLRARRCRPRDGAPDRAQREGPAARRLQLARDAARPRGHRGRRSCRRRSPSCTTPASSWSATSAPASSRARCRSAPPPTSTGRPSTTR